MHYGSIVMEFVHLQQWLYTYHTQNKHDDCGLVYSMNVAYLHKNAFLISISAPFFGSLPCHLRALHCSLWW